MKRIRVLTVGPIAALAAIAVGAPPAPAQDPLRFDTTLEQRAIVYTSGTQRATQAGVFGYDDWALVGKVSSAKRRCIRNRKVKIFAKPATGDAAATAANRILVETTRTSNAGYFAGGDASGTTQARRAGIDVGLILTAKATRKVILRSSATAARTRKIVCRPEKEKMSSSEIEMVEGRRPQPGGSRSRARQPRSGERLSRATSR
jgi:hypothetical protein